HAGLEGELDVDTEGREPGELLHDARQMDVAGGGADAELEAGALPRPTRILADRLRHVGCEPARALDHPAPGRHDAGGDQERLAAGGVAPRPAEREHRLAPSPYLPTRERACSGSAGAPAASS